VKEHYRSVLDIKIPCELYLYHCFQEVPTKKESAICLRRDERRHTKKAPGVWLLKIKAGGQRRQTPRPVFCGVKGLPSFKINLNYLLRGKGGGGDREMLKRLRRMETELKYLRFTRGSSNRESFLHRWGMIQEKPCGGNDARKGSKPPQQQSGGGIVVSSKTVSTLSAGKQSGAVKDARYRRRA